MPEPTAYDTVTYPDLPFTQTHPDRAAAIATLHGVPCAPPSQARVLDIGCGGGANLIGIAHARPELRGVGVDLAASAIERAKVVAAAAGVHNVDFDVVDLRDMVGGELGEFDYVIAHGMYAWLPEEAREALLAAIAAHLVRDGIAFVSFNAHPGGHGAAALREAALWHTRQVEDPLEQAVRARELFELLLDVQGSDGGPFQGGMQRILRNLVSESPAGMHHDILGPHWRPVWLADFAAHAAAHGLSYMDEAVLRRPRPVPALRLLHALGGNDRIAREQYSDILRFARFHIALVCRGEHAVAPYVDRTALAALRFTAAEVPEDPHELPGRIAAWLAEQGPAAIGFEELRLALDPDLEQLEVALLEAAGAGMIIPWLEGPPAQRAGERPLVSALARWQAAEGEPITTLIGDVKVIDDVPSRTLIRLLDGSRDRDQIAADLEAQAGVRFEPGALERNLDSLSSLPLLLA